MKKIISSLMFIGLMVFSFMLPNTNASAAENTPLVNKVQITNIGNNEYIDYGQGKKYRVYAHKNSTFKGFAFDAEGKAVPAGTTFYIYFDGVMPFAKKDILCTVGENGAFEGSTEIPTGKGDYTFWSTRSTHYYDIVTLGYYNGPNKTNPIPTANENTVYHFAFGVYHP